MPGLPDSRTICFTLAAALCSACPPASTDDTGGGSTSGSTSGSTAGSTSGSTSGEPTTGGEPQSTGEASTGEPVVTCQEGACSVTCTRMLPWTDDNGVECLCDESQWLGPPEGRLTCELPQLCGEQAGYLCAVQAIRWQFVGSVRRHGFMMDDGSRGVTLEVLGDGTARGVVNTGQEYGCCDGSTRDLDVWYDPFTVPAPDHPFWDGCFTAFALEDSYAVGYSNPLPHCLDPERYARTCTGAALDVCPTPPPPPGPDATCAETCPMAGDGVCDEAGGSGLCPDGCDPIDCTCEPDTPDFCDEVHRGGPCPIGSDVDCICEPNFPFECDELDDGGHCPTNSDPDCD